MQRRITFRIVAGYSNNQKAVQPRKDGLVLQLQLEQLDHDEMTVVLKAETKEDKSALTVSEGGHQRAHINQPHAIAEEAALGDEAALLGKSDHWLVKLLKLILKRIDVLLYKCFLEELVKKCAGEVGKLIGKLIAFTLVALLVKWLLG